VYIGTYTTFRTELPSSSAGQDEKRVIIYSIPDKPLNPNPNSTDTSYRPTHPIYKNTKNLKSPTACLICKPLGSLVRSCQWPTSRINSSHNCSCWISRIHLCAVLCMLANAGFWQHKPSRVHCHGNRGVHYRSDNMALGTTPCKSNAPGMERSGFENHPQKLK
jgi:hypothetical protein